MEDGLSLIQPTCVPQAGLFVFSKCFLSFSGVAGHPPGTEGDGGGTGPDGKNPRGDGWPDGLGAAVGEARGGAGGGRGGVSGAGWGHLGEGVLGPGSWSSSGDVRRSVSGAVEVARPGRPGGSRAGLGLIAGVSGRQEEGW